MDPKILELGSLVSQELIQRPFTPQTFLNLGCASDMQTFTAVLQFFLDLSVENQLGLVPSFC